MPPDPTRRDRLKPEGLVVAGVGFLLTRYTVAASATTGDLPAFLVGQATFLVVGLGLATFGVALAVSTRSPREVRTVAAWCVLGTLSMGFVLGLTLAAGAGSVSGAVVSRVLLGGAVGGVLTGIHSTRTAAHRRALERSTDRLAVLNRILRHEVLNKVNVVQGYAGLRDDPDRALATIDRNAAAIGEAIESVGVLTGDEGRERVVVADLLRERTAAAREAFPDATVDFAGAPEDVEVLATSHIGAAVDHLVENAVVHGGSTVRVGATAGEGVVSVSVADDGPGMPAEAAATLERDGLPEYDDPTTGFGLAIVRLVAGQTGAGIRVRAGGVDGFATGEGADEAGVESEAETEPRAEADTEAEPGVEAETETDAEAESETEGSASTVNGGLWTDGGEVMAGGGTGATADGDAGTTVELTLPRADVADETWGVPAGRLVDALVAALVAGVLMSGVFYALAGGVAVIGALYGAAVPVVGWITHLFHSAVFAIAFAGMAARPPFRRRCRRLGGCVALGAGWGVVLSLVAAGVVMPVWLGLVGIPPPVPNLSGVGVFAHLVWGASLGTAYHWLGAWRVA